jgi:hypothetical protein
MSSKQSRSEANLNDLYARLDAVRMSAYERERAKASLARAEAVAEAVDYAIHQVKRLLKNLLVRPFGRPTKLAG